MVKCLLLFCRSARSPFTNNYWYLNYSFHTFCIDQMNAKPHQRLACWVKFSVDGILKHFSYFPSKQDLFDVSNSTGRIKKIYI